MLSICIQLASSFGKCCIPHSQTEFTGVRPHAEEALQFESTKMLLALSDLVQLCNSDVPKGTSQKLYTPVNRIQDMNKIDGEFQKPQNTKPTRNFDYPRLQPNYYKCTTYKNTYTTQGCIFKL